LITENVARVIPPAGMSSADIRLLEIAHDFGPCLVHGRHRVATALRTGRRQKSTPCPVEGSCRRSSICAEEWRWERTRAGIAPSQPFADRRRRVVPINLRGSVSVLCAPCGVCREFISDYTAPRRRSGLPATPGSRSGALDLLPFKDSPGPVRRIIVGNRSVWERHMALAAGLGWVGRAQAVRWDDSDLAPEARDAAAG